VLGTVVGVIFFPPQFFFPALMAYIVYGVGATVFAGLLDRMPNGDDLTEPVFTDDEAWDEAERRARRRRRRRRRDRVPPPPDSANPPPPTEPQE
jgi:cytochrome c